jgi:hypothetical protein
VPDFSSETRLNSSGFISGREGSILSKKDEDGNTGTGSGGRLMDTSFDQNDDLGLVLLRSRR